MDAVSQAPEGPPLGGDVEVTRTPIRRVWALAARQQHGAYAFLPPPGGLDHSGDHRRYRAELVLHQWSELPARRYLGSAGALEPAGHQKGRHQGQGADAPDRPGPARTVR